MAQLHQRAIHGARFLDVEESLLFEAVDGGLKKNVDLEAAETVDRVGFDKDAISGAVEFDGAANLGVNNLRVAADGCGMTGDAGEVVEGPLNRQRWGDLAAQAGKHRECDGTGK